MSGSTWGDSWGSCWGDTWGVIDTQGGGIRRRVPLPGRDLSQDDEEILLIILAALHIIQ